MVKDHIISYRFVMAEDDMFTSHTHHFSRFPATLRNIKLETILFIRVLGEGAFGRVYLGTCTHLFKGEITMVAVKTLKGEPSETMKADFDREAELLSSLQHDNIVTFYGVCTEGEKYMMIFEFMENGDLNNYLRYEKQLQ